MGCSAFVALLPFYGRLAGRRSTWWLWTCLAGFGLGLFGLEYCRRRRRAREAPGTRSARQAPVTSEASGPPPTRWARAGSANAATRRRSAASSRTAPDVDGEARLADALAPRGARILDVGSGMGRVAAALARRGHDVVAVEPDPPGRPEPRDYPDLDVIGCDVLALDAEVLAEHGRPTAFDLVVCVGNVLVFLAEDTERRVLTRVRVAARPGGRVLAGFHLRGGRRPARTYPPAELVADAEAAGLRVDLRAGSYELHPRRRGVRRVGALAGHLEAGPRRSRPRRR